MYAKQEWKKAKYDEAYVRAYETIVNQLTDEVEIKVKASMCATTVQKILDVDLSWKIDGEGAVTVFMNIVKDEEFPDLPRFGLRLFLKRTFKNVSYFGMGPCESYRDKHRASSHGLYHSVVFDMHEDYIKPQENGSHYDCDYVEIESKKYGLTVVSEKAFSFNASVFTQEELERKLHNYELEVSKSIILCIDYAMNGIGSNSCGPEVMDRYRFDETKFSFRVKLIPYKNS